NQLLIQKMKERGYVLDEEHNYTIHIPRPEKEKRGFFHFLKRKNKDVAAEAPENDPEAPAPDPEQ
ncbi:MAG: hypothetical protein II751_03655, partial [Bacteroidales bacterium]|nr:hypothetical protein [Bacteroidales bacterium]